MGKLIDKIRAWLKKTFLTPLPYLGSGKPKLINWLVAIGAIPFFLWCYFQEFYRSYPQVSTPPLRLNVGDSPSVYTSLVYDEPAQVQIYSQEAQLYKSEGFDRKWEQGFYFGPGYENRVQYEDIYGEPQAKEIIKYEDKIGKLKQDVKELEEKKIT